jgi:hypothetical protein
MYLEDDKGKREPISVAIHVDSRVSKGDSISTCVERMAGEFAKNQGRLTGVRKVMNL